MESPGDTAPELPRPLCPWLPGPRGPARAEGLGCDSISRTARQPLTRSVWIVLFFAILIKPVTNRKDRSSVSPTIHSASLMLNHHFCLVPENSRHLERNPRTRERHSPSPSAAPGGHQSTFCCYNLPTGDISY